MPNSLPSHTAIHTHTHTRVHSSIYIRDFRVTTYTQAHARTVTSLLIRVYIKSAHTFCSPFSTWGRDVRGAWPCTYVRYDSPMETATRTGKPARMRARLDRNAVARQMIAFGVVKNPHTALARAAQRKKKSPAAAEARALQVAAAVGRGGADANKAREVTGQHMRRWPRKEGLGSRRTVRPREMPGWCGPRQLTKRTA